VGEVSVAVLARVMIITSSLILRLQGKIHFLNEGLIFLNLFERRGTVGPNIL